MPNNNKFYVTTPIYYVTAKPHLGSLYSTVLADISARWHKLLGQDVFFLTGTDEHGQKIAQAAESAGQTPKNFVDSFIASYKTIWHKYDINYDKFIRTTDQYHVQAVQAWLQALIDQGDIYKATYNGWYCTPDETFVTEKEYEVGATKVLCPSCNRETVWVAEESYFFRLTKYQDQVLAFLKNKPGFIIPAEKANEVIRFVESGLKDLCISRSTINWGVPFPNDNKHVAYVWADALNNYITAVGFGDKSRAHEFHKWWPADLQILGKDILRFHAVYWPAFLMASGLPLPKHLLVHGWIKVGDQKMSKSLGNVIDPEILYDEYGSDQIRYYLASQLAITHDSSFDINNLREILSADLANSLGNLLSRSTSLALKHNLVNLARPAKLNNKSQVILDLIKNTAQICAQLMAECSYHMAVAEINRLVARVNAYFHELEPWQVVKVDHVLFNEIIWTTCAALEAVTILFWPVMPKKMVELATRIGSGKLVNLHVSPVNLVKALSTQEITSNFVLQAGPSLFVKYEKLEQDTQKDANMSPDIVQNAPVNPINYIDFADFLKVELLVGTIEVCEQVPGSEKLLRMDVNFGEQGIKQVLSGIRQFYAPDEMIGRQGVFVFNLKPRKIMGYESHGMLLSVPSDGGLKLVSVAGKVASGARLV